MLFYIFKLNFSVVVSTNTCIWIHWLHTRPRSYIFYFYVTRSYILILIWNKYFSLDDGNRTSPVKTTRQVESLACIARSLLLVLCFQVSLVSVAEVVRAQAQGCPGGSSVTCGECDCNCDQSGTSSSDPFGLNSLINSISSFLYSLLASVLGSTNTVSSMMWSSHRSHQRIKIQTFVYVESCFVKRSPMFKSTHRRYFFTYISLKVLIFIKVFLKHSWSHTNKTINSYLKKKF